MRWYERPARSRRRGATLVAMVSVTSLVAAAKYEVPWFTIDAGGGRSASTSGSTELIGIIGQPDAGVLSGGDYHLVGGFLPVPRLVADCDGDLIVDLVDYAHFANTCLTGPGATVSSESCRCDDIDGDGDVDLKDAALFWSILGR